MVAHFVTQVSWIPVQNCLFRDLGTSEVPGLLYLEQSIRKIWSMIQAYRHCLNNNQSECNKGVGSFFSSFSAIPVDLARHFPTNDRVS